MTTRRRSRWGRQALLSICWLALIGGFRTVGGSAGTAGRKGPTQPAGVHSYDTKFPLSENPISESGNWAPGSDAGAALFGNIQTTAGFAFGVNEPTPYGDPTAMLTGTWGHEQTVTARVKINKVPVGYCCHEVEVRLRVTISPGKITGYEAYCSVMPNNPYCHIARWNGPNGSFWNFETGSSTGFLVDGDMIKATAVGQNPTVITLYKNGVQILQATDTGAAGGGFGAFGPWPSGNPGVGFFDNIDNNWKDFGISSFSAMDGPIK
jgi:hypothetical protein